MSLVPFTFKNVELKVVTINDKPWARAKEVRRALEYNKKTAHVIRAHCTREKYAQKYDLTSMPTASTPVNWSMDSQKNDLYINEEGMYELLFSSQQPLAKKLRKHYCKVMFPHIRKQLTNKMVEEHQKAIRERENVIEEKDAAIALLNDDLDDTGKQLVDLEHGNHELQNEVERLQERYVPYLQDNRKDNGMAMIQKNNGDEYPYVAICGQQGYVAQKIQNKLADYLNAQLVVLAETLNSILHYNWLRERCCIIANPDRVRHFRLGEHYTHRQLMVLQEL